MTKFCVFCCLIFVRNPIIFLKKNIITFAISDFPLPNFPPKYVDLMVTTSFSKRTKSLQDIMGRPSGDCHNVGCALESMRNFGVTCLSFNAWHRHSECFSNQSAGCSPWRCRGPLIPPGKEQPLFRALVANCTWFSKHLTTIALFHFKLIFMVFKNRHQKFSFWKLFLRFQLLTFLWKIFLRFFSNFSFSHFALFPKIFLFLKTKNVFLILPFIKTRHTALVISFQEVLKSAQFSHVRLPKPRL